MFDLNIWGYREYVALFTSRLTFQPAAQRGQKTGVLPCVYQRSRIHGISQNHRITEGHDNNLRNCTKRRGAMRAAGANLYFTSQKCKGPLTGGEQTVSLPVCSLNSSETARCLCSPKPHIALTDLFR